MTTKTDITLPPLPVGFFKHRIAGFDGPVYAEMQMEAYARAAVEADRADHFRGVTKMMPSDEELDDLSDEFHGYSGNHTRDGYLIPKFDHIGYARALLSRYSSGQPVASAEADREKLMRAIVEAGQRAGIIRADLETASVTECLHILECLSQPAASPEPSGYAYRYPDGIRFNDGREVNGCKPTETLPYWFGAAPVAQDPVAYGVLAANTGRMHQLELAEDYEHAGLGEMRPEHVVPLYAAPVAAQAQRVVNQQMTTAASDVLADTQRAIIEAADRRGYARAEAENVGYRTDAGRYRFIRTGDAAVWCSSGDDLLTGDRLDAAIDAARAAKGEA